VIGEPVWIQVRCQTGPSPAAVPDDGLCQRGAADFDGSLERELARWLLEACCGGTLFYFAAQQSIDSVNDDSVRAVTNDFVVSPSVSTQPTADYAFCRRFLFAQKYYLTISVGSIT